MRARLLPALLREYCKNQNVGPPPWRMLNTRWSQQNPPSEAGKRVYGSMLRGRGAQAATRSGRRQRSCDAAARWPVRAGRITSGAAVSRASICWASAILRRLRVTRQLQPLVAPQLMHFKHVPLRTSVKLAHSGQLSPS